MILAWTAAGVLYIVAAIGLILGLLALASVAAPPGKLRTLLQLALALVGLIVAGLLLWN